MATLKKGGVMEIVSHTQEQPTKAKRRMGRINFRGAFRGRRKVVILAGMFALLIVTGYLNFALSSGAPEVQGQANQTMFQMFRTTRQAERTSQLAILENMALSQHFSAEARANAEAQKLELLAAIAFETAAEGLILAAGFRDVVVSKNGENVNVLVQNPENITPVQATQIRLILDSVANRTIDIDNIFISVIE